MYSDFLKLCGYEPEEIEKERPRIDRAFEIMEIGPDDIKRAEGRLRKYVWVESLGMRKILGIWLKDMVDLVLAKEEGKKTVYTSYPPIREISAITACASDNVVGACPEVLVTIVMGFIFDKLTPYLEKAESLTLRPGLAFCSLLKARMGAIAKGLIPIPTLTIPSGLVCDQAPKVDEILHEMYGFPVVYVDTTWDEAQNEYPVVSPRRVKYVAKELENAVNRLAEAIGVVLSDDMVKEFIGRQVEVDVAWQRVLWLTFTDPMPLSLVDRPLASSLTASSNLHGIREGVEALSILRDEVQKRIDDGFGIVPRGSPRVWLLLPNMSDPRIAKLIEGLGIAMPVGLHILPDELRYVANYDKFWELRADINLRLGSRRSVLAYCRQIISACREFQLDGVIMQYHIACHMYDILPLKLKEMVQKELGIPVLLLEGDWYETRDYSAEGYRTRLECFAELVKASAEKMRPTRTPIKKMKDEDLKWFSLR